MSALKFSTAGIPSVFSELNTFEAVSKLPELDISGFEISFVRNIYLKEKEAEKIGKVVSKNRLFMSAHAPYYINLNSDSKKTYYSSIHYIKKAAESAALCGARSLVIHSGYYMKSSKEKTYKKIKGAYKKVLSSLSEKGINIELRPETSGKLSQFGELGQLLRLSEELEGISPCIDFAHLYAYSLGENNSFDYFRKCLVSLENKLGKKPLKDLHMHVSGMEFGEKGEVRHLPLSSGTFNYKALLEALKDMDCGGVLVSESPLQEKDAVLMKNYYDSL